VLPAALLVSGGGGGLLVRFSPSSGGGNFGLLRPAHGPFIRVLTVLYLRALRPVGKAARHVGFFCFIKERRLRKMFSLTDGEDKWKA